MVGPIIYLFFMVFILLGSSNAVNLTDGLDGLAISVTFIAMSALTGLTYLASDARWAERLDITHNPAAAELTVFCGAMVGASLGFLWYNAPPAEVFMGDVGIAGDRRSTWDGRDFDQAGVSAAVHRRCIYSRGGFGDATGFGVQIDKTRRSAGTARV